MIELAAADPSPAAVITCARGFAAFPAAQTPETLVRPAASTRTKPSSSVSQPRYSRRRRRGGGARPDDQGGSLNGSTVAEYHAPQAIDDDDQPANLAVDDADAAGFKLLAFRLTAIGQAWGLDASQARWFGIDVASSSVARAIVLPRKPRPARSHDDKHPTGAMG